MVFYLVMEMILRRLRNGVPEARKENQAAPRSRERILEAAERVPFVRSGDLVVEELEDRELLPGERGQHVALRELSAGEGLEEERCRGLNSEENGKATS